MSDKSKQIFFISIIFYLSITLAFYTYYNDEDVFEKTPNLKTNYWITYAFFNLTVFICILVPYLYSE